MTSRTVHIPHSSHCVTQLRTPYHLHHAEDEALYVLEGEITVIHAGEKTVAGPGSYIFLPRGVPHGFRSSSDNDSRLLIHAMPGSKAVFVGMVLEMSVPVADRHRLPEATQPDLKKLNQVCDQHGIKILGPFPI
jgi:uncharacterized protein YjlB